MVYCAVFCGPSVRRTAAQGNNPSFIPSVARKRDPPGCWTPRAEGGAGTSRVGPRPSRCTIIPACAYRRPSVAPCHGYVRGWGRHHVCMRGRGRRPRRPACPMAFAMAFPWMRRAEDVAPYHWCVRHHGCVRGRGRRPRRPACPMAFTMAFSCVRRAEDVAPYHGWRGGADTMCAYVVGADVLGGPRARWRLRWRFRGCGAPRTSRPTIGAYDTMGVYVVGADVPGGPRARWRLRWRFRVRGAPRTSRPTMGGTVGGDIMGVYMVGADVLGGPRA